jgi:RimJ/RimL family protein N-acetyltransferase
MKAMTLARATAHDISFIMACERRPDYERLVGRWPEAQHIATMAEPDFIYLVGSADGERRGFVILHDRFLGFPNLYLKRVAVHDANRGFGRVLLAAVTDWVFANTETHRFWLEVVETNTRAAHVYRSLGWREEGCVREAFVEPDGTRGSYIQMSLLRPEWQAPRTA